MTFRQSRNQFFGFVMVMALLSSPSAFANDDLDVTMRMVTDDESLTDSVVREIRLDRPIGLESGPAPAGDLARDAREQGRAFGQEVAEGAREAGRLKREMKRDKAKGAPEANRPDTGARPPVKPETGKPKPEGVPAR